MRHRNPVYDGYFADPFVWQHDGTYFAIGTGEAEATAQTRETVFPMLQSADFLQWRPVGRVMVRPDPALGDCCWAPAVARDQGVFYLYYSIGHGDERHQLRVAESKNPTGPYRDAGICLLNPQDYPFAIDPHPFRDDDGSWYLFYARDFLDFDQQVRAGTALMVARMKTMTELEDPGRMVLRACQDWQRFAANRTVYGHVWDWHTLEGPCVQKHEGKYYCFYSGGRWENQSYGVDYGIADQPMGPYRDDGNERGPRVLRTVPGKVIGPGHNTVATGPDGQTEYLVYHAWDSRMTARRMFIDRLVWTAEGPTCEGPTLGGNAEE